MRQWTVNDGLQPETPNRKLRPRGLSARPNVNMAVSSASFSHMTPLQPQPQDTFMSEMNDEDGSGGGGRLSRHIPQRDGVDMSVSTYNLLAPPPMGADMMQAPALGGGGGFGPKPAFMGMAAGGGSMTPSSSVYTSLSDSLISDDSSYMTSLYNDILAEKLSSRDGEGVSAAPGASGGGGQRLGLGGEVLRFTTCNSASGPASSSASPNAPGPDGLLGRRHRAGADDGGSFGFPRPFLHGGAAGGGRSGCQRVLYCNPERVLDAPEFPSTASQLIHWGSNNKLVIGLKNSLFTWDAATGQAGKLADMHQDFTIRCVSWLHKCACVALAVNGGTTAIYDCRSEDFLRQLRLPGMAVAEVTGLAVNGPILAISVNTEAGATYVHDLRCKNSLTTTFEGHRGAVTSMQYSSAEPYYLATGGADGAVRVWDARRSGCPRYAFDGVHTGAVTALHWNPERRSKLFTAGDDSVLCMLDTHARVVDCDALEDDGISAPAPQFVSRAVKTLHPISGICCNGDSGELVTSHRGKGQLQLRKTSNFHLMGVFTAPSCEADLSCMTLSPDKERVCAAQGDETLKFWRVFQDSTRNRQQPRRDDVYADPFSSMMSENQLR